MQSTKKHSPIRSDITTEKNGTRHIGSHVTCDDASDEQNTKFNMWKVESFHCFCGNFMGLQSNEFINKV